MKSSEVHAGPESIEIRYSVSAEIEQHDFGRLTGYDFERVFFTDRYSIAGRKRLIVYRDGIPRSTCSHAWSSSL